MSPLVEDFPRQDYPKMDYLDGNAAAGLFSEIFSVDITIARGQCESCGNQAVVADARMYPDDHGMVLRCSVCENVLLRVVQTETSYCLDLRGLSFLEFFAS